METDQNVEKIKHSLELDENLKHHLSGWKVQKIGGILIILVILLTALGLFGSGVMSRKKMEKNGTIVHYEKFLRYEKEMKMDWHISGRNSITFAVPMKYLDYFKIEKVIPEGYGTTISNGNVHYTFEMDKAGTTVVQFYLTPQKVGNIEAAWMADQQEFQIAHFIYP